MRLIDGIPVEEFIEMNADEIFLVQEGYYEILDARQAKDKPNAYSGSPGESNLTPELPHHRSYGTLSGGSEE